MAAVQSDPIQSTEAQLIGHIASLSVKALIASGQLPSESCDLATSVVERAITSADAGVKSLIQEHLIRSGAQASTASGNSRKKRKSSKPRKRTAYNMFVKSEMANIRATLGDAAKVRGAPMKEAGRLWKTLDADAKKPYAAQADEFNAKIATDQPSVRAATPVIPPSLNYDDLVGPFPGTYALGVVPDTKSFKTLDEAVSAMRENLNAAAIVRSKNGKKFRLRAGYMDTRNKSNQDSEGNATPVFVYNDNTTEHTWLRKITLAHHAAYGPFTKTNPFCANKKIAIHGESGGNLSNTS